MRHRAYDALARAHLDAVCSGAPPAAGARIEDYIDRLRTPLGALHSSGPLMQPAAAWLSPAL